MSDVLTYLDRISLNATRDLVFMVQMGFRNLRTPVRIGEFVVSNYPSIGFLWVCLTVTTQEIDGVLLENEFSFIDSLSYTSTSFLMEHFLAPVCGS